MVKTVTLGDLNKEVDYLNKKYCKNTKNHLKSFKRHRRIRVKKTRKPVGRQINNV